MSEIRGTQEGVDTMINAWRRTPRRVKVSIPILVAYILVGQFVLPHADTHNNVHTGLIIPAFFAGTTSLGVLIHFVLSYVLRGTSKQ